MIHPDTLSQLGRLTLADRPLVLCDVDEVVLQFVPALERFLSARGCFLDKRSFALTGNIRRLADGVAIDRREVGECLHAFFAAETHRLEPVPGAQEALQALAESAQIVLLTNIYGAFRQARIDNLKGHDLTFPVITNEGPKGPAVAHLAERSRAPVFFLDDAPTNVESVLAALPDAHVIHFIADQGLAEVVQPIQGVRLKTSHWPEAHGYIGGILTTLLAAEEARE